MLHHLRRPRYCDEDLAEIATVVGIEVTEITPYRAQFDQAAFWFNAAEPGSSAIPGASLLRKLDQIFATADKFVTEGIELSAAEAQLDDKTSPSETDGEMEARREIAALRKKFNRTAKNLMRLLGFTAKTAKEAEDGLLDSELEDALVNNGYADGAAIGELVQVITKYKQNRAAAIETAQKLANSALSAKDTTAALRELMVTPGNHGRGDINGWIDTMLSPYCKITGNDVGTSIRSETDRNAGDADGPLIRFLQVAGKPLGLDFSPHGWRSRVRTAQKAQGQK